MPDLSKLQSLDVENKGQKIDEIYEVRAGIGVIDQMFERIIGVDNSVEDHFTIWSYGVEIEGSYPEFEERMNGGKGGSFHGRAGLLINGEYVGEPGWKTYLVTFKNTSASCMANHQPTPNLVELLEEFLVFPEVA